MKKWGFLFSFPPTGFYVLLYAFISGCDSGPFSLVTMQLSIHWWQPFLLWRWSFFANIFWHIFSSPNFSTFICFSIHTLKLVFRVCSLHWLSDALEGTCHYLDRSHLNKMPFKPPFTRMSRSWIFFVFIWVLFAKLNFLNVLSPNISPWWLHQVGGAVDMHCVPFVQLLTACEYKKF